ncbi:hypothetical protein GCM10023189_34130 [Nibrella saemangeumensis]|uniref:Signal transduction histidine kinase internal region domain-containing protein n=1 Tax=Nibrella saemangeumensis TaxID=1084526 RepID=A0ABP8N4T5_9BACT
MKTLHNIWPRIIGIPVSVLLLNLLWLETYQHHWGIYAATSLAAIVVLVLVSEFALRSLKAYGERIREDEALKKVSLQSQFDCLKTHINPHFLFNSLNSLSVLIAEDKTKAENFLDELSTVYRYMLQSHACDLMTLRTELTFIRAYFSLMKTRYGNAIDFSIDVDDRHLDTLLPPLTLHILVENAIRHNIILAEQPLLITINATADGQLVVCNNIQRKPLKANTLQVGLDNISSRFRLLHLPQPAISDNGQSFTVQLPLLQKSGTI